MRYSPKDIEPKWQHRWDVDNIFHTPMLLKDLANKPKYYALDMFPYPSGAGLHVGHPEGYTATDVVARYKRMKGFNVLHVMGWDAFGLPAERAAMRDGLHPAIITKRNIANFKNQIKRLGFFYDWSREISTTDDDYYRWTQWIFLKLYDKGLAYLADVNVNWCPALKTVLANEEVKDGRYVETGDLVEKRLMRQWMLKITAYAERLLADLDDVDWPESVKEMQRNWIGKSEGAIVYFDLVDRPDRIDTYTTRPDTIFGVNFLALAPEHPLAPSLLSDQYREAGLAYIHASAQKNDALRQDATREKTGIFTGAYAINPLNKATIPIYLADYVLVGYGSGAVMAVPAEDERDREFAQKYSLPISEIIDRSTGHEVMIHSDMLNGLTPSEASTRVINVLVEQNLGVRKTQFKLRDWLFSRQRYWGEPFPIVYDQEQNPHPVCEKDLPIVLPPIDEYKPTDDGRPPLARADQSWLHVTMPDGRTGFREVNTMPQWAGSCWYYLRYIDPHNTTAPFAPELEKYWMPVDLYIGGVEHAVLHLLYSRFWHKVLFDCGLVHTKEPFQKLFNQGMILAHSYQDQAGKYYHPSEVVQKNGAWFTKSSDVPVKTQLEKMSKSRSNVVNPDEVIDDYGADAMRLYELFMGPLEQVKPWQMAGVEGVYRFLQRTWRLVVDEDSGELSKKIICDESKEQEPLLRSLHRTIEKVGNDIENLRFNTAVAQMMSFVNEATAASSICMSTITSFLSLLSPFAPHICDELNERLGLSGYFLNHAWPIYDENMAQHDQIDLVLQVNGKRRANVMAAKGLSESEAKELALNNSEVKRFIAEYKVVRVIFVADRLVNVVVT